MNRTFVKALYPSAVALLVSAWAPTVALAQLPEQEETSGLRRAGDIIHIALPATAAATTLILKDWEGSKQFAMSFGFAFGTVFGLKEAVEKSRPDDADARSFPSGHTMMAFSGASFITKRYGPKYGIPALGAAAFVGYTRIRGQKHFADDVLAGAGIAVLYNWWITTPYSDRVVITPISPDGGYGVHVLVTW